MGNYILAHDLGTSGNKATLYQPDGQLAASAVYEYPTCYPYPGFVEQNPGDWWRAICESTKQLLETSGILPREIAGLSFSAQMMGCLLVDDKGAPLRPMIIWADTRATEEEKWMKAQIGEERGYRITGHRLSASYSAAKLLWVRNHEPDIYARVYKMLHAKDYIIYRLTGKFVTDYSDASGTNLFDIAKKDWSTEILTALDINPAILPQLHASSDIAGTVSREAAAETGLLEGTPVVIGGGDGSCACVGAGVVEEGNAYCVLGSSSWISSASREPLLDPEMKTFNWVHLDPDLYTPCGTMQAAGYSYRWYRDTLCEAEVWEAKRKAISPYQLINEGVLRSKPGAGGLLYLPYLLGERSPRWNADARGAFVGLSVTSTKEDISRAVLEGVGFNLRVILECLQKGVDMKELILIGGGAKGPEWMQILADIWQMPLKIPVYLEEATSMGAAVCAGVGVGIFKDYKAAKQMNQIHRTVMPNAALKPCYDKLYDIFNESYDALQNVYRELGAYRKNFDV